MNKEELIDSVRQSPRNSSLEDIIRLADLAQELLRENAELRQANKELATAAISDDEFQQLRADAERDKLEWEE